MMGQTLIYAEMSHSPKVALENAAAPFSWTVVSEYKYINSPRNRPSEGVSDYAQAQGGSPSYEDEDGTMSLRTRA